MKSSACPGVTVAICSNGEDLKEYCVSDLEQKTFGYVESTAGQTFGIKVELGAFFRFKEDDILFDVSLDGKLAAGRFIRAGQNFNILTGKGWTDGNGHHFHAGFTFGTLATNEQPLTTELTDAAKGFGQVIVDLFRGKVKEEMRSPAEIAPKSVLDEQVPEKALKGRAMSTRACFAPAVRSTAPRVARFEYKGGREPFLSFIFDYRSHADLQTEGLIARTPSPIPLEDRDPASLTAEEAREALAIVQRRRNEQVEIKQEIKREREDERDGTLEPDQVDGLDDDDDDLVIVGSATRAHKRVCTRRSVESSSAVIDLSAE